GCEFAQMFRRFGSAVTVVDMSQRLLAQEEDEASASLAEVFRGEGMALEMGRGAERVDAEQGDIVVRLAGGGSVRGSHLLVAVGRVPNTDDPGCEAPGIS